MDAPRETSRTRASGEQQSARGRIVRSAAALVRERGVHGVGLRQIVAHADGPRGSLQRYFPGGKTQLVIEALHLVGAEVLDDTDSGLNEAITLADAIDAIFAPWRKVLIESSFTMGCPLAATVVDASENDELRAHVSDLLVRWQGVAAQIYIKFGASPAVADEHATVLLSALEGALILARAHRSVAPLDTVERYFAARAPRATD